MPVAVAVAGCVFGVLWDCTWCTWPPPLIVATPTRAFICAQVEKTAAEEAAVEKAAATEKAAAEKAAAEKAAAEKVATTIEMAAPTTDKGGATPSQHCEGSAFVVFEGSVIDCNAVAAAVEKAACDFDSIRYRSSAYTQ